MSEMDAYRDIFASESAEFIQGITDGLLALESNSGDLEPVEVIFRGAHSLKGMAAAMGYDRTADLTHRMEGLMELVRSRTRAVDSGLIDLMLEAVDVVRDLIGDEMSGSEKVDPTLVISRIDDFLTGEDVEAQPAPSASASPTTRALSAGENEFGIRVILDESCVLKAVRAYMVLKRLAHIGLVLETVPTARDIEDERFEREFSVVIRTVARAEEVERAVLGVSEISAAHVSLIEVPADETVAPAAAEGSGSDSARTRTQIPKLAETQTVRVSIGHLDKIVDMVGELVILRSRLERIAESTGSRELSEAVENLRGVASELQHEVMHARMVPVGNIFNRFPRMVRDLARDLGKEVVLDMDGLDIELDRTVLDEIGDPIVHLLRNSVDHGIETPDVREGVGKPAHGTVRLTATRDRDLVRITLGDDGNGIDAEKVWAKAVSSGLVEDSARDSYREDEILLLTCIPGFSTAETATKVSGRGVGMDVVKGKIEHLGGSVNIYSIPGMGTEILLTLPLTLAIIQSLLVSAKGRYFAIPLSSVDEALSPSEVRLETVDDAPVMIMRDGKVLPLFRLDTLFEMGGDPKRMPEEGEHIVLIADNVGQQRGLVIGELHGRTEVVVKPMSHMFRQTRGLGGATVLGDGTIAFILDTRTIFPTREEL